MRKTRRMVTLLSLITLLLVNIIAIGLFSSSAYEVKSGQQPAETATDTGTPPAGGGEAAPAPAPTPAPAPSDAAPVVVVPKTADPQAGKVEAATPTATEEGRDDADYKGFAVIDGYKFDDLNGNGVRDAGEPGLSGVTITCTWAFIVHSTVTDASGYFRFPWCIATTWKVEEHGLDGYYSSSPASVDVTVTWWEYKSVNFGNARYSNINGLKFRDLNGNGVLDPGEPGIPGVTIRLDRNGMWTDTTTNAEGWFYFNGLQAGDYTVSVDESSMPDLYPSTDISQAVSLLPGETRTVAFGNVPYGTILGYKFADLDLDGVMDPGEPGISGVTIEVSGAGIDPRSAISGPDGLVSFPGLRAGVYLVRITNDPAGYYLTTPGSYEVALGTAGTATVYFGNAPYGTIHGYKFIDSNGDGVMDGGERGMPGVTVQLTGDGIDPLQAVTDSLGYFRFTQLEAGDYLVKLLNDPPAYYLTTPGQFEVLLASGGTGTAYFGNALYGKITGYKYEDSNGNGAHDAGEPPVGGVTVNLLVDGEIVAATVTNGSGYFEFGSLEAGTYAVQEIVPDGFYNTSPVEVAVELEAGETGRVEFLNARRGRIFGYKWEDLNGNGSLDNGEPAMEGVTIRLANTAGDFAASTVTDEDGYYEFTELKAGAYRVGEVVPEGYRPTTPDLVELQLNSGGSRQVDFLNTSLLGSIAGTKWDDRNGNGKVDDGEVGLEGITIQLWTGIELKAEAVSGADGTYLFDDLPAGDYIVMEVVPQDRYPTSTTSIPVTLADSEDRTGVDFLNASYASITGNKWDDPDQDGVHTPDESPVPGVVITLSRTGMVDVEAVTGSDGGFSFGKLEAGTYTVTETLPTGSQNTTPLSITVTLEPGDEAVVYFLNVTVGGEIIEPPVTPTTSTGSGQLPLTGMNQFAYYLAAALLMLLGLLTLLLGAARNRRPSPSGGGSRRAGSGGSQIGKWL